jgi:nucleotide-binding universal stress UspA family protein
VLTVPAAAPAMTAAAVAFRRIFCAIDHSPSALQGLRYALELGRQAGGRVTVLYALEYLDPEEPCEHVDFDIRSHRRHFIEHARARLHAQLAQEPTTWCEIEEVVAIDRAYKAILSQAAASNAELIVMGAQGTGGVELMLYGSNTQHVVRAATCPVLTVRA